MLLGRLILAGVALVATLIPTWWLAGRLDRSAPPFLRLLIAGGLACVGYVSFVNLAGRLFHQSTIPAAAYLVGSAGAALWLWRRRRDEVAPAPIWHARREWAGVALVALVLGFPQWLLAVSSPYYDEVASSAIHLTAANQFAEGVFPPRHNALPDVVAKYHYGFAVLSGSVHWLTGLSANVSIDVVSTALWLFTFLFAVHWLRSLGFARGPSLWGGTATLLGGGLAWAFVRRVETYSSFDIVPPPSVLVHRYADTLSLTANLMKDVGVPSAHLRNPDGSLSNLPWDIAAQFQQHAVSLGIALGIFALWLFVRWQRSTERRTTWLVLTVMTFSILFLAHAVFGGVAAVTGGLVLLGSWLRAPTRRGLIDGVAFGVGIAVLSLLHGGFLAFGAQYGVSSDVFTLRHTFGYSRGGATGFVLWNVAAFGIPMFLAIAAWIARRERTAERDLAFLVISVFSVFSYLLPQLAFYSSETIGVEQSTEVSKFFFTAHLGFALLSAWGVAALLRRVHWGVLIPTGAAMVFSPLLFTFVHSTKANDSLWKRQWLGVYFSPYYRNSVERHMGEALGRLKQSSRETYFDASADERVHGYLSEMLAFGGSVFTLTPSRYERTGFGYRLSQDVVAARFVQNGRMAQLRPGAAEACQCRWFYSRPDRDFAFAPAFLRARFDKLVADGVLVPRMTEFNRVLYSIDKPTLDVDRGIERFWRPRVVMQASADFDGDGRADLAFHDYTDNRLLIGSRSIAGPASFGGQMAASWTGRFNGGPRASVIMGRADDTRFQLGRRLEDIVEETSWIFATAGADGTWSANERRWGWDEDIPLVARSRRGPDAMLTYNILQGRWFQASFTPLVGPRLPRTDLPVPVVGRFLPGSELDLVLRSRVNGYWVIVSQTTKERVGLTWGAGPNEVLVPGDWDGDGRDELGIYNEGNQFWYWRHAPDGPITQFHFGVAGAVPLPFDYNNDGALDAAYWIPAEGKIYVTYSRGRSVDRVIAVPPHALPAFVNVF